MPGVLVDDQPFSLDAMSQAFLLDSLSSPSSCGSPLSLPFQASSPSPAPAPCLQPCFTRAFSHNSSDAELSRALSQLSPLLHHHRQAAPRAAGGLGRSSLVGAMEGLGTEDFLGERFAVDQQEPNCDGSLAHRSGELVFGGLPAGISELQFAAGRPRAGNLYTGNELEEQDVGLPFSSGGSLWGGQTAGGGGFLVGSPTLPDAVLALQKFLPSNLEDDEAWPAVDVFSCDEFRMFEFKVKRCMRGRSHDWTECPFSHPGEKARRRDPRRFHYSGTACPDFRKGNCKRGDACEFAHGVFECWLHPARYRTQPCKDERNCKRRVCFFAHTPEQLRLLPTAQAANGGSSRSSSSSSPPLKSALAQKLAQCAVAASYDGSPLRCCAMGAPFVDASSQIIDAGSPPGFRDAVTMDGASPFARLGSFGGSNGSCRSAASLLSSGYLGSSLHHSPASLSPPLSPSMSPPGSPDDWSNSLTKNLSCLATPGPPSSPLGQTGNLAQFAFSGQSVHPLQNQGGIPAHRRHLDRLNSALSLSIPADQGRSYSAFSSPTSACPQSSNQMVDLIGLLKQAELSGPESYWLQAQAAQTATMIAPKFSSGPSPLRRGFQSVPGTPTKMGWKSAEVDLWGLNERKAEPALERVESGRCLRAKIFESLVKGNEQGCNDDPDVGWVNELVKEELR